MKIILVHPQIPQNTGNIARTCAVTGTKLHLVPPIGFDTSDRWLKRAGLDYWNDVVLEPLENLEEYLESTSEPFYFFSSKVEKKYTDISFKEDSLLIFGSESTGLPEIYHEKWPERFATIPMLPEARCLNLATSVGIVLFEALRQQNFQSFT